mgnify:CR=1 FL=1
MFSALQTYVKWETDQSRMVACTARTIYISNNLWFPAHDEVDVGGACSADERLGCHLVLLQDSDKNLNKKDEN